MICPVVWQTCADFNCTVLISSRTYTLNYVCIHSDDVELYLRHIHYPLVQARQCRHNSINICLGVVHNCQHLPISTESTNLGGGGEGASVLFLKC